MKKMIWNVCLYTVAFVLSVVLGYGCMMYCTSAEVWYSGMHDEECEGENCKCYQRFLANEK